MIEGNVPTLLPPGGSSLRSAVAGPYPRPASSAVALPVVPLPSRAEAAPRQLGLSIRPSHGGIGGIAQAMRAFGPRAGVNPPAHSGTLTGPGFSDGDGGPRGVSDPEVFLQGLVDRAPPGFGTVQPAQRLLQEEIRWEDQVNPSSDYPRQVPRGQAREQVRFGSRRPTPGDYAQHFRYSTITRGADLRGLPDAARHMRHFLRARGSELRPNIPRMIAQDPDIREAAERSFNGLLGHVRQRVGEGARGTFQVDSQGWWQARPNTPNWFLALGDFSLAHTATVMARPRRDGSIDVLVTPRLHVSDQYDWHREKPPVDLPVPRWVPERLRRFRDADALALVEAGLAREYSIRGSLRRPLFRFRIPPPARAEQPGRR